MKPNEHRIPRAKSPVISKPLAKNPPSTLGMAMENFSPAVSIK
jgi:hypothetical protein